MSPTESEIIKEVQSFITAALQAADPSQAVRRHLRIEGELLVAGNERFDPREGRIFLVAAGKAALSMGTTALDIIKDRVWGGVIITKQTAEGEPRSYFASAGRRPENIAIYEAGHPIPTEGGVRATRAVMDLLQETSDGDLVLCLLSGGASALLTSPYLHLAEWRQLVEALLKSGCSINELNCVRKQLDRVKGGGLAALAAPAKTVSLILSDVVGNPLDIIASGPTVPNPESPGDALTILHKYEIMKQITPETWSVVSATLTDARHAMSLARVEELDVTNVIVGDVRVAASAVVDAVGEAGFEAALLTAFLEGEAREVGKFAAALAKELGPRQAWVLGGETTVTVVGDGLGGRNQELALAAALALDGVDGRMVVAFTTDGEDGPTDASGAVVTGETAGVGRQHDLDPELLLKNNDSHTFFRNLSERTGRSFLLETGPTGTNVNDLLIVLNRSPRPV